MLTQDSDAQLVQASVQGDREAFGAMYDRYAGPIYGMCRSMLRDPDDAEDATHEVFVRAAERLGQLREPAKLKPWLFAVARSQVRTMRRHRAPEPADDLDQVPDSGVSVEDLARNGELHDLIWAAAGGLGERDRQLLELQLRQGLEGGELAEATGVKVEHLYVMAARMRGRLERSLGALLVARNGASSCDQLGQLLAGWDRRLTPKLRKRISRHVERCVTCRATRRRQLSPAELLSAAPLPALPIGLRDSALAAAQPRAASMPGLVAKPAAIVSHKVVLAALLIGTTGAAVTGGGALRDSAGQSTQVTNQPARAVSPATSLPDAVANSPASIPDDDTIASQPGSLVLEIPRNLLDLGSDETEAVFELANSGEVPLLWSAEEVSAGVEVGPFNGVAASGQEVEVTVAVDRGLLEEGSAQVTVVVTGGSEEQPLLVEAEVPTP